MTLKEGTVKLVKMCLIAGMLCAVTPASAEHISMTIRGQRTGMFKGEGTSLAHRDEIPVAAVSHQIVSPRDARSGLPTGKRTHKPLVVTKSLGTASPQFINALVTNENLPQVVLTFRKRGARGEEQSYYTIRLINANITGYAIRPPDAAKQGGDTDSEELTFTYQKIEVESLPGHLTAGDDWEPYR